MFDAEHWLGDIVNIAQWSIFYELRAYALLILVYVLGILQNRAAFNALLLGLVIVSPVAGTLLQIGDSRGPEITLAFLYGVFWANEKTRMGLGFIFFAAALLYVSVYLPPSYAAMVGNFSLATLTVGIAFGKAPYIKLLDRLPDFTYGLYLTHWPIMMIIHRYYNFNGIRLAMFTGLCALAVSAPLHYLVEEPGRRLGRIVPRAMRRLRSRIDAARSPLQDYRAEGRDPSEQIG
ncbi:hypothetical protein K9U39_18935 [Rhodoblastus acidophilus]|uniref:Acyltransferase 3 domain-containing protein n=2 Tax=Candidatus Rhodoblastus alkanivorans TaxID=2954117 RepID=A0ABS9Z2U5_9HYPH|nr:hypothetical protein [Candidatus Rhodoblastus alkanivorans]MCI4681933.1 hypothetical protein [Candidatus Rhodoblastus alkanivorans]MDI4642983.1 hypothetical protein [Rhodoblastus acidophilus]